MTRANFGAPSRSSVIGALVFVAFCGLLALLEGLGDAGRAALRYDRSALEHGELWRLITGHLVHLGWAHLGLNLAGLALLWALFARMFSLWRWLTLALFSAIAIDAGFYWLEPQLQWYVGLSGVLHGVLAAGACARWQRRDRDAWILAGFLIVKLLWEQSLGPLPSSEASTGGAVVVDAHLYGALGGAVCAFCLAALDGRARRISA